MSNYFISDTNNVPTVFNTDGLDVDFKVSGVSGGFQKYLFFDASTGRLGINTSLPDSALHIVSPCADDGLKIESTTNCSTGVRLLLLHNPGASPDTNDYPATIDLAGRDLNSSPINYAQIRSKILDPNTSLTSGELQFRVDHTGTLSDIFRANTSNVVLGGNNSISGHNYNVMGANNNLSGLLYINLGSNNEGTIHSGLLLGNNISVDSDDVVCVSNDADAKGDKLVLFGNKVHLTGNNSIVIANSADIQSDNSIVVGNDIELSNNSNNNTLVLHNGAISGVSGIGFGSWIMVTGHNNLFFGHNVRITGSNNSVIGSSSSVSGSSNVSFGSDVNISGSNVVSLGLRNSLSSVTSGMFIGHDIRLSNSSKTIVMGLNNSANQELDNSILIGIDNTTSQGEADDIVIIGQKNIASNISNSLIAGNKNNVSGTVYNSVVLGPDNYTSLNSANSIIIGALNNNSGLSINTQGSVEGTPTRATTLLNNTNLIGINNLAFSSVNGSILGNKNSVSGSNTNSVGSFNVLNNVSNVQSIGNSNFVNGSNNNIFGSRISVLGSNSIVVNPTDSRAFAFGSGNLLIGNPTPVVSGISVGHNNRLFGVSNIVYGRNNRAGVVAHKAIIRNGNEIRINGDVTSVYSLSQKILIAIYNPVNDNNIFIRDISTDFPIEYTNGIDPATVFYISESVISAGSNYTERNNFDDTAFISPNEVEAYVYPYEEDSTFYIYGNSNIIVGQNNIATHSGNLLLGNRLNISGVNNIVIGNNISGNFLDSLQIGTSNTNKIYLDNESIVFNTGQAQASVTLRSRGGTNLNDVAATFNLSNNRLGINTANPRSSLDISGTLTTNALRVGLSSVAGYTLISDINGNATWQFPVNLSGVNSGLLYKVNDQVASGSNVLSFNNINKHFSYIYTIENSDPNIDPVDYEAVIFTPTGLLINLNTDNDGVYNVNIYGSGVEADENGDDTTITKLLLETVHSRNMIKMYNVSGLSGEFQQHKIIDSVFLPTSLTGTFLRVNGSDGRLDNIVSDPGCILHSDNLSRQTGDSSLKFYRNSNSLTIGATGLTPNEQITLGVNTAKKCNIVLGFSNNMGTIFNANGASNQSFSIYNSGAFDSDQGLHYSTQSGVLGINVGSESSIKMFVPTPGATSVSWTDLGAKFIVNGTSRLHNLQLLPNQQFPENAAFNSEANTARYTHANSYLRIDKDGYVQPGAVDLTAQFSGTFPLTIGTAGSRVTTSLSSLGQNNVLIPNGSLLVHRGGGIWTNQAQGLSLFQTSTLNSLENNGLILGQNNAGTVINRNSITIAGAPFRSGDNYIGSNQYSKHFLMTRTLGGNVTSEFLSNFNKNINYGTNGPQPDAPQSNYIDLEGYLNPEVPQNNPVSRSGTLGVWNYTINYCGLVSSLDNEVNQGSDPQAVAGKLEGAFLFYRTDNQNIAIPLGNPSGTYRFSASLESPWPSPPVIVDFPDTDPFRMRIRASGLNDHNILWNCSVDIHQLNHPTKIGVSGQA